MKILRWAAIAGWLLLDLSNPGSAQAACNAFPGARAAAYLPGIAMSPAAKQVIAAEQAARERASAPLLYLGPLGRVDNLSFEPGAMVLAATDTTCAGPIYSVPMEARPSFQTRWLEKAVAVVVTRPESAGRPIARVYTQSAGGGHGMRELCGLHKAFAGTGIVPLDDCAQATMRTIEVGPGKAALGIPLPTEREFLGAVANTAAADQDPSRLQFSLMAMAEPESAAEIAKAAQRIQIEGCMPACRDFASPVGARGVLCIDQVFNLGWNRYIDRVVYLANGFPDCDARTIDLRLTGPTNTFKNLCEIDDAGTTLCTDPPPDKALFMRQDSCGRLHVPFKWDGIFVDKPVVVAGHSATSRKRRAEENRIWIPGREFVGSTPTSAGNSDGTGVDWRKPDIAVWYPNDAELGLKGVVDKSEPSTVHIFPNYEVRVLCDKPSDSGNDEACEGVDRGVNASIPNCACRDRYDADCTCKLDEPGRYFACNGGGHRTGMPCTRHDHCNPNKAGSGGLCTGTPVCRAEGAVYNVDTTGLTGGACETDEDCANDPNGLTQCGYLLFDLSAQKDTASDPHIQLDQRLKKGGKKRRGACVDAPATKCDNLDDTVDPKGCPSGECRGYRLLVTR